MSAYGAFVITPSDTAPLPTQTSGGIYVGGTGNLTVIMPQGGQGVEFQSIPAGTILPIQVRQVMATGTTATELVGLIGNVR